MGIVVQISVPPGISPAVVFEQIFEHSGGVELGRKAHYAPVNHQGPPRGWLGMNTVVPEAEGVSLPFPKSSRQVVRETPSTTR